MPSPLPIVFFIICAALTMQLAMGEEGCTQKEMEECAHSLGPAMSTDNSPAAIAENLDQVCNVLQNTVSCIKRKVEACISDAAMRDKVTKEIRLENLDKMNRDMCNEGGKVKKIYRKHRKCIESVPKVTKDKCEEQHVNALAVPANSQQENQTKICCAWYQFAKCNADATESTCGDEAVEFSKDAFRIIQETNVKYEHCHASKESSCPHMSTVRSSSLQILQSHSLLTTFGLVTISAFYVLV